MFSLSNRIQNEKSEAAAQEANRKPCSLAVLTSGHECRSETCEKLNPFTLQIVQTVLNRQEVSWWKFRPWNFISFQTFPRPWQFIYVALHMCVLTFPRSGWPKELRKIQSREFIFLLLEGHQGDMSWCAVSECRVILNCTPGLLY